MVQPPPVQGVRQSLAFGAADILSGENEADVTIPEIQLLEDELNQLDADFSYFDDLDGCNSDEDFPEGKKTGMVYLIIVVTVILTQVFTSVFTAQSLTISASLEQTRVHVYWACVTV